MLQGLLGIVVNEEKWPIMLLKEAMMVMEDIKIQLSINIGHSMSACSSLKVNLVFK